MASPLYTLDFSPMTNALAQYRQGVDVADQNARYRNALANVGGMPGVTPGMLGLVGAMDPEHGVNALFSASNAAQQRAQAQAQLAEQMRQHNASIALQQQQLRLAQQAEARQGALTPYDIEIRRAEAANKQMDTDLMRGLTGGGQQPAPSAPVPPPTQAPPLPPMRGPAPLPQQNAPRSPLPLPGEPALQPQSGDGFDPSMVRPIADVAPQGQAPAQAAPQMIRTPFGEMTPDRAQQMAGILALRGKNEAAKLMEKAIEQANLGKHTQDKIGEKAFNSSELSARLDGIAAKYNDTFQTYETGLKMKAISWLDSFEATRNRVPPEDRRAFEEYTQFRRAAVDNLTQYIKEVTGAAMGVQEEKRIRQGVPDPMKDSPAEFRAKLTDTMRTTKAALARYNYLIAQGYDPKALAANKEQIGSMVKIDDMPRIINQRGAELKQKIMSENPQADAGQVDQFVAQRIKREFGI